jgi:hypothetical protein
MKIAVGINFGDNDFQHTFIPLLDMLNENFENIPTKEQIVEIVNEVAYGCYLACQCQYQYNVESDIKDYLKITLKEVLLGNELDEYIKTKSDYLNYALYYVYPNGKADAI